MKILKAKLLADFDFGTEGQVIGQHKAGSIVDMPETMALEYSIQGLVQLKAKKAAEETAVEREKNLKENGPVIPEKNNVTDADHDGTVPEDHRQASSGGPGAD